MFDEIYILDSSIFNYSRDHCGHDHMVVGSITIYGMTAYHHWSSKFESSSGGCTRYNIMW